MRSNKTQWSGLGYRILAIAIKECCTPNSNLAVWKTEGWKGRGRKTKELRVTVRPRAILVVAILKSQCGKGGSCGQKRVLAFMTLEVLLRTSGKEESGKSLEGKR